MSLDDLSPGLLIEEVVFHFQGFCSWDVHSVSRVCNKDAMKLASADLQVSMDGYLAWWDSCVFAGLF